SDPAITKHIANFLYRHAETLAERVGPRRGKKKVVAHPTAILFNGGVFKAQSLQQRVVTVVNQWGDAAGAQAVKVLTGNDLDLAVARGAAYYGQVRRGQGVPIRGRAGPVVPFRPPPSPPP